MSYVTSRALRTALEYRLLMRSQETNVGLDRLRRRVVFERIVARLEIAEPGRWVLKGGMALEVRLQDKARLTKDIDLGLRDEVASADDLHARLIEALIADPQHDMFVFIVAPPGLLSEDGGGHVTWRVQVLARLADKFFGGIKLDISPRSHELTATDRIELANSLDFASIPATVVEVIDLQRHAAEKLHAMSRDFGERENSRVRDLVDLMILIEHDLLSPAAVALAATQVWAERDGALPPAVLWPLPESWPARYERSAAEHELDTLTFPAAVSRVDRLWQTMFPNEEI